MKVIGLNFGEFNSSAAICENGHVLAGAAEERFTRQKKTKAFPKNALEFALEHAGSDLRTVDAIAQAWNPGAKWVAYNPMLSNYRIKREDYFYTLPDHLYGFVDRKPTDYVKQELGGEMPPIYYVQHHRAHAANAFFLSNFDQAAFLTADWQGELECLTKGVAEGTQLTHLDQQWIPHSVGMFYATFTQMLGYRPDNDEWKVMALAAEQVDASEYAARIKNTVKFLQDGRFELDQSFYSGAHVDQPMLFTDKLLDLLDGSSDTNVRSSDYQWQCKVARAMQSVAEEIAWHILRDLYDKTGSENLVLSGGFFMNSVLNGKVLENTNFRNVYISHSPDDLGNSIGAALYVTHCINDAPRQTINNTSNIGPEYSDDAIEQMLERRKISYEVVDEPEKEVARLLSDGNVVAVHQGRMEFGDRALGYRSILGDPRSPETKDKINGMIKYRESYRPFAPATSREDMSAIFDVPETYHCNYMEKVVMVRENWRDKIPAVTHFDGSARLQTVDNDDNPYFYAIIKEFARLTEIPVVLNTSFNINGEPIVQSPDDAVSTFFNSGLRYLMINKYLIKK